MKDDPEIDELQLLREELLADYGGDIDRLMEECMRHQYTIGRDLYGYSKETGRIEIVFRAPRP